MPSQAQVFEHFISSWCAVWGGYGIFWRCSLAGGSVSLSVEGSGSLPSLLLFVVLSAYCRTFPGTADSPSGTTNHLLLELALVVVFLQQ